MITPIEKKLVDKINNGEGLTDDELSGAIMFYSNLYAALGCLGEKFYLVTREVGRTIDVLQSYLFHRQFK